MSYVDAHGNVVTDDRETGVVLFTPTPGGLKLDSDYFRAIRARTAPFVKGPYAAKGLSDPVTAYALMGLGVSSRNAGSVLGTQASPQLLADLRNAETGVPDADRFDVVGDFLKFAGKFAAGAALTYGAVAGAGALAGGGSAAAAGGGSAGTVEAASVSILGPATGTVTTAPVIGAAGAPTVTAIASGGLPFVPTLAGLGDAAKKVVGELVERFASGGGVGAPGALAASGGATTRRPQAVTAPGAQAAGLSLAGGDGLMWLLLAGVAAAAVLKKR